MTFVSSTGLCSDLTVLLIADEGLAFFQNMGRIFLVQNKLTKHTQTCTIIRSNAKTI